MSYGQDETRRPEFGKARDLESRRRCAALLPEWKGLRGSVRERYWGFDLSEAPLNGLVWAPVGEGPFPLVLIVHGNHSMVDVSDPGYAYLGELLASRGFIVVSVDENYINGSWSGDFRGKEMASAVGSCSSISRSGGTGADGGSSLRRPRRPRSNRARWPLARR